MPAIICERELLFYRRCEFNLSSIKRSLSQIKNKCHMNDWLVLLYSQLTKGGKLQYHSASVSRVFHNAKKSNRLHIYPPSAKAALGNIGSRSWQYILSTYNLYMMLLNNNEITVTTYIAKIDTCKWQSTSYRYSI